MHTLKPARLKPGVTLEALPEPRPADVAGPGNPRVIRGSALIFWDPKVPGKKLEAIDTDQITPAADCVSESLETLDVRWKAGSFRYLMPDFRARVHRGETFVIAGDRFAIGSSREMTPAGLKGVADEAGLEMVVVAGNNMGDIFRRNAFNLGLHVVQSPEAVADAQEGDRFAFDPDSRALKNETRGTTYRPIPLTAKEDEIRRSGGIFAIGRREFRESVARTPEIVWPDAATARGLTTTEQIVWAHRVDKNARVEPGATLRVYADLLPASDGTAPFSIHTFNQITGGDQIDPRQIAIANDHFVFTGVDADEKQTSIGRAFAKLHDIQKPYYATPGDGIFHFYFPEQGLVMPGQFIPGADSHSRAYGAYGAVGIGVGSTTLGFGWSTGYIYFTLPKQRRVVFKGELQPWVTGKDIVLALLKRWGSKQSQGMSVEFVDTAQQMPIAYRNTICNMMAEAEAMNGIFAPDDITYAWYRAKGMNALPYPRITPGADARYEIDEEFELGDVAPMIAKPFSPGNAFPADEVARERIEFDKAMIGSCTNGGYDDLLSAALVIHAARAQGRTKVARPFVIFPGSGGVKVKIETPDPRLDGESIANVFRSVGGEIRESWCGPCFGQGPDALTQGQRAITSFNRNWTNRMGVGGEGYLASPAVVAASALLGYMGPPSELGLEWVAEEFGVSTSSVAQPVKDPRTWLYPPIDPFRTGRLPVSGGHDLYFEQCGTAEGKPAVFLHGGPGGGTSPKQRRLFHPGAYHAVLFDQRGCGKSTPHASLEANTTWDLVADIERLREHLGIERWLVLGGSWGSTLALAYAQKHPDRVTELVLRGIFLVRPHEIRWFYQQGTSFIYPDVWERFVEHIPAAERGDLVAAYHRRLTSADAQVRLAAARRWSGWEGATSLLIPDSDFTAQYEEDSTALAMARIEAHYFVNRAFLETEDQLLRGVDRIRHIPAVIVQGRYDVICPPTSAWDLHRAWPEADFILTPDSGHSAFDPPNTRALVAATDRFAGRGAELRAPRA